MPFAPASAGADPSLHHGRTVASLFSGVGGFDLGLERAGWDVVFQCEQDPFRQRVLAHHWPDAQQCPDVRKAAHAAHPEYQFGKVDLLCGGFPCQDLSVAGRRAGLAGERSGLFFEFARIADRSVRPGGFVLIENVPGLLSSNNGRDFAVVLATLAELGFHDLAWRIMDSRYFGVAQRRRRVYVLGRRARGGLSAEVLLEQERSGRDLAARRPSFAESAAAPGHGASGARVAGTLTSGSHGTRPPGRRREDDENIVAYSLNGPGYREPSQQTYVTAGAAIRAGDLTQSLTTRFGNSGVDLPDAEANWLVTPDQGRVAHTLTSEGFDASEDGTGRGTPIVVAPDAVREDGRSPLPGGRGDVGSGGGLPDAERDGSGGDERGGRGDAAESGERPTADADGVRAPARLPGRVDGPAGVDAYALRGREGGMQAEPIDLPNLRAHTGKDGGGVDGFVHDRREEHRVFDASSQHGSGETGTGVPNMSAPGESLTLTTRSDRYAVFGQPVGFQSTLGSLAADGVQDDGVSVPLMTSTPAAVSYEPDPPRWEYPEGSTSPYDPRPDGPRYAAMGDAVTVNVLEWIGLRLATALDLEKEAA